MDKVKPLQDRRAEAFKKGEQLGHEGFFGKPSKRPPSNTYRSNYDKIFRKKEVIGDGT